MDKAVFKIEYVENLNKNRFRKENFTNKQTADKLSSNNEAPDKPDQPDEDGYRKIEVQYNPSSIKYGGSTSHRSERRRRKKHDDNNILYSNTLDVSFTLVFHKEEAEKQSVRQRMELVMNTICGSPTKNAAFDWSSMHVKGRITSFSGKYDMFDMKGEPTSGQMDITIRMYMDIGDIDKILKKLSSSKDVKDMSQRFR